MVVDMISYGSAQCPAWFYMAARGVQHDFHMAPHGVRHDFLWLRTVSDMIWYGMMRSDMTRYGMVWYATGMSVLISSAMLWHDMAWSDRMWYDMTWGDPAWYVMIWYDVAWRVCMIVIVQTWCHDMPQLASAWCGMAWCGVACEHNIFCSFIKTLKSIVKINDFWNRTFMYPKELHNFHTLSINFHIILHRFTSSYIIF